MRIRIGNTWLASGGREAAAELSVNGQQAVDEPAFFRALAATFYARGRASTAISFVVSREHASVRDAEVFLLMHWAELPKEGTVLFVCGTGDDTQSVSLAGAVLEAMPLGTYLGRSTRVAYTVRGGVPTSDLVPGPDPYPTPEPEEESAVTRRATVAIPAGVSELAVEFVNAMTGTPTVIPVMVMADGAEIVSCWLKAGSVSATGFTVGFSVPVPGADYQLSYHAIL